MNKLKRSQKGFTKEFLKLMTKLENACCVGELMGIPPLVSGKVLGNDGTSLLWVDDATGGGGTISGSGTSGYIPKFNAAGVIGNSMIKEYTPGLGIAIDDITNSTTTTNAHAFFVRNGFVGDATANQTPLVLFSTTSAAAINISLLNLNAPSAAAGSVIKYTLGRSMSVNNMFFHAFNYVGSASASNYVNEVFYSGTDIRRIYASGNTVIGALPDSGFKFEVGGTVRITSQLTMGAPTTSVASFNLPTGVAPSAPVDGDVWREDNTNTGLKIRINGVTKTITVS